MKTFFKILLVCVLTGSFTSVLYSQSIKPIIDFVLPDPDMDFELGETIDIYVHVKVKSCGTNSDTSVFGNLFYWYQTDSMGAAFPPLYNSIDADINIEEIPLGGKMDTIPFYCDSNELRASNTGPVNVIIIWPALLNSTAPVCDSSQSNVLEQVFLPVGVEEEAPQKFGSTVFPNPATPLQLVFINSKYSQEIAQVSIVNAMGQVLSSKEFTDTESSAGYVLPTQNLRAGIYHIHIFYKDKKNEVVKFIKN